MDTLKRTPARFVSALAVATALGIGGITAIGHGAGGAMAAAPVTGGYVDLVKQVSPAVVMIEVTKQVQGGNVSMGNMPQGFPFQDFQRRFGMPFPDMQGDGPGGMIKGAGTGFIISTDGEIVTNAHVVDGAETVSVTLTDGRSFDAKVIGADPATDVAVLKIDADNLTTVGFGDSDALQVGENVVAVGNPLGVGQSVTTGIVSAIGRDLNSGPFDNFIQTDAAINKGNSGGPLFNEHGQVIGMNTAIISPNGGSVGLGFAVPSDMVKTVVADLTDDGTIERGWLGVQIQPVSDEVAAALGMDAPSGVMIAGVQPDTPAEKVGLKKGDIVLSVDTTKVGNPRDLTRAIAGDAPGTTVTLTFLRGGKEMTQAVTLGSREAPSAKG
ncbi:trypsin-like peptidase domain-containing protein [Mesobacterium sp. TK19101]|uniref:Trypsin-like peptidase domain-containing protein n=1 Tax=Mesobacterium hydrothermale TaxID=3111907 RepID=A0ABU6HGX3_9RHOB|nr:trypsin-like peptidase domain-containing protein [Mesobacterium sp. TK19101]MEC3861709.1 trypsin-like peptidase domain-containing protein [Mesobacterium sp. TK19101]